MRSAQTNELNISESNVVTFFRVTPFAFYEHHRTALCGHVHLNKGRVSLFALLRAYKLSKRAQKRFLIGMSLVAALLAAVAEDKSNISVCFAFRVAAAHQEISTNI
jgi:hypothetical protein